MIYLIFTSSYNPKEFRSSQCFFCSNILISYISVLNQSNIYLKSNIIHNYFYIVQICALNQSLLF